jgi:dolichyl-phosphate beta-glucosyltransferase
MNSDVTKSLSIVIPAYNEELRLGDQLARAVDWLEREARDFEILVVDDGSTDRTLDVGRSFADRGVRCIRFDENRGKGAAVRRGVLESRGARVLMSDADFSTPITELGKLESHLASAPIVIGSRAVAESEILTHQPFYREWMGKTFNLMLRLFGVWGLSDTQCGF